MEDIIKVDIFLNFDILIKFDVFCEFDILLKLCVVCVDKNIIFRFDQKQLILRYYDKIH